MFNVSTLLNKKTPRTLKNGIWNPAILVVVPGVSSSAAAQNISRRDGMESGFRKYPAMAVANEVTPRIAIPNESTELQTVAFPPEGSSIRSCGRYTNM